MHTEAMRMNTLRTIAVAAILGAVNYADLASRQTPTGNAPAWATRELRAGIIGTDTSHVPQFTKTRTASGVEGQGCRRVQRRQPRSPDQRHPRRQVLRHD